MALVLVGTIGSANCMWLVALHTKIILYLTVRVWVLVIHVLVICDATVFLFKLRRGT